MCCRPIWLKLLVVDSITFQTLKGLCTCTCTWYEYDERQTLIHFKTVGVSNITQGEILSTYTQG